MRRRRWQLNLQKRNGTLNCMFCVPLISAHPHPFFAPGFLARPNFDVFDMHDKGHHAWNATNNRVQPHAQGACISFVAKHTLRVECRPLRWIGTILELVSRTVEKHEMLSCEHQCEERALPHQGVVHTLPQVVAWERATASQRFHPSLLSMWPLPVAGDNTKPFFLVQPLGSETSMRHRDLGSF